MEELVSFVNDDTDDEQDSFSDIPPEALKRGLTDEQVWQYIKVQTAVSDFTAFQRLVKKLQLPVLQPLRSQGASFNQLQRITGLGKGIIQRS